MKICTIIPVYNEANAIASLVQSLTDKNIDVVVIDDGSTDESASLAEKCGAIVIQHQDRHGKGYTLKQGFAYALEHAYEGVIMLDGDGQHSPEDINVFIDKAKENADCVVIGNRMAHVDDMPFLRRWTNRVMSFVISFAANQHIPDTQCGYRYIGANVLRDTSFKSEGFEIETEIILKAHKRNFPIFSVPIQTIYEDEISKIHPVKDTIRFLKYFLKEIFSA